MDWLGAIVLGIFSSLHCVGMCGPIALALHMPHSTRPLAVANAIAYNLGRVITYALLGMVFGLVGRGFVMASSQHAVSIVAGVIMILLVVLPLINAKLHTERWTFGLIGQLKNSMGSLFQRHSVESKFYVGLFNGLLPCGMVYIALAGAIGQGDVLGGGAYMMFFGFGTIPLMFVVTLLPSLTRPVWRNNFRKIMPVIICLVGVLLILRGLNLGIPYVSPVIDQVNSEITNCD